MIFSGKKVKRAVSGFLIAAFLVTPIFTENFKPVKQVDIINDGVLDSVVSRSDTVGEILEENGHNTIGYKIIPAVYKEINDNDTVEMIPYKAIYFNIDGNTELKKIPAVAIKDAIPYVQKELKNKEYRVEGRSANYRLNDGDQIKISTLKDLTLNFRGKTERVETYSNTVGDFLKTYPIELTNEDHLSKDKESSINDGDYLGITNIHIEKSRKKVEKDLKTIKKEDSTLLKGKTKVEKEGSPRITVDHYEEKFTNNKKTEKTKVKSEVVQEGSSKVIVVGTQEPKPPTPEVKGSSGENKSYENSNLPKVRVSPGSAQAFAHDYIAKKGWGEDQFSCLVKLWNNESGWQTTAGNKSSGAYGIPQALPGSKMATFGSDWQTNPETQIKWGVSYISGRYGNPCGALNHFNRKNWY